MIVNCWNESKTMKSFLNEYLKEKSSEVHMDFRMFSLLKMQFESLSVKVLSGSHFVLVSVSDYDVSQRLNPFPNTTFGCKDI